MLLLRWFLMEIAGTYCQLAKDEKLKTRVRRQEAFRDESFASEHILAET